MTVNGSAATRQAGGYFHKEVPVANGSTGAWPAITTRATQGAVVTEQTGQRWVPGTPETFSYDWDGNLTGDGRWTYTWDAENRLVRVETKATLRGGCVLPERFAASGLTVRMLCSRHRGDRSPAPSRAARHRRRY